ncbi:helix-turn-helix transcriptional regulator [Acetobacter oryzifermentans]|uniref:helix-turn-helix transcriptional regulator n=1 Tax=Acetobacter oryzifermentans TaxID=1633874 RepID=UPI0007B06F8D|nr:AraC family transcriptional regulator [Acetobacter oryzifermentans]
MAKVSSTQVHQSHPNRIAGTSLLYPHSRGFPGGLLTSGFVSAQASELSGYFDEPGLTARCTVILSGSCSMKAGGQIHHFETCDLILARTSRETFTFENSAEFSALEIHVPPLLLGEMNIDFLPGIQARSLKIQDPAIKTARRLLGYLRMANPSSLQVAKPNELIGYGLAMTTLGYAFASCEAKRLQLNGKKAVCLETARQTLLKHFDRAPTILQLAALCDLSPTRFKELFRQQFGCAPYTLYQAHRMERARSLLREKNVTETAMELGYSNVSHFSAAFQRQFGYTPSKWQRLIL